MQFANNHRRTDIEMLADISFFIFLLTSFVFSHSIIGQAGMMFFFGAVFLLIVAKQRFHYSFYFFFSSLFIFYNYMITEYGISINKVTSIAMTKTLLINFIFGFMLFNYLVIRNDMQRILKLYLRAALLFTGLMVIISGSAIFSTRLGKSAVVSIAGLNIEYNANFIATVAALGFVVGLYEYLSSKNKRNLWNVIWFIFIILLTGSRKGVLMVLLGTALLIFMLYPKKRTWNILMSVFVLFILYMAVMYIPWLYKVAGSRLEVLLSVIHGNEIGEASMNTRLHFIQLGWEYFLERPWTGYGLDCFRHLPYAYDTYSHNNYIELLVSGGIFGFILYYLPNVLMYLMIFKKSHRAMGLFKVVFTMFLIQQFMEFANVTYFERVPIMILLFTLASFRLNQQKKKANTIIGLDLKNAQFEQTT